MQPIDGFRTESHNKSQLSEPTKWIIVLAGTIVQFGVLAMLLAMIVWCSRGGFAH
jgi:hypothetical protein